MPLLSIARFIGAIISVFILGYSAYLLWSWYDGYFIRDALGQIIHVRERWKLWAALALLAWSFLGGLVLPIILARGDKHPFQFKRGNGVSLADGSGVPVYVEEHGKDLTPTIIFTHGWSLDSTVWQYALHDLGNRFRCVIWDLPGMGRSQPAHADDINLTRFSERLAGIISASNNGSKVILVGHSIGGMTIQTLAKNQPGFVIDHVAGIILLNTTYTNPLRTMILPRVMQAIRTPLLEPMMQLTILLQPLAWLSAWQSYLSGWTHVANRLAFGRYVTRRQLNHISLLTTRNPPGNVARGNLAMFAWDATGALRDIPVPVLVIAGSADIITKPGASRAIASASHNAELIEIQSVNHMGFFERPDEYNRAIAAFGERVCAIVDGKINAN